MREGQGLTARAPRHTCSTGSWVETHSINWQSRTWCCRFLSTAVWLCSAWNNTFFQASTFLWLVNRGCGRWAHFHRADWIVSSVITNWTWTEVRVLRQRLMVDCDMWRGVKSEKEGMTWSITHWTVKYFSSDWSLCWFCCKSLFNFLHP